MMQDGKMERSRLSLPPPSEIKLNELATIFRRSIANVSSSGVGASSASRRPTADVTSLPIDPMTLSLARQMGDASALHLWSRSHFIIGLILFEIAAYLAFCGPLILFTVVIIG